MKSIFIPLILLLLIACNPKNQNGNFGPIIPNDSMIIIVKDIYLTDAMLTNAVNSRKIKDGQTVDYYTYLFDKYSITKERFDMSVKYYCNQPNDFIKIYQEVMDQLLLMEAELKSQ